MKLYAIQTNDGKYLGRKGSSGKLKEARFFDTVGRAEEQSFTGTKIVPVVLSLVKKRGPDKGFNRYPILKKPKTGKLVY